MNNLSPWEVEKYSNMTKALSEGQRKIVLANLRTAELYEELDRRKEKALERVQAIQQVLGEYKDIQNASLLDMQDYIRNLEEVLYEKEVMTFPMDNIMKLVEEEQ